MYKHILIPTDGSELAAKAIHQGLALAKALGAEVTIATASEPWDAVVVGEVAVVLPPEEYDRIASESASKILAAAKALADQDGVACKTLHIKGQHAAEGIIKRRRRRAPTSSSWHRMAGAASAVSFSAAKLMKW